MGDEVGIVAREGVLVAEQNGQRRYGRPASEQAGSDFRKVAFLAGRRTPLARFCGRFRSFSNDFSSSAMPAGTPSSVTPTSGPCDSPKIETLNSLPKLFIWLSFRCGRSRPAKQPAQVVPEFGVRLGDGFRAADRDTSPFAPQGRYGGGHRDPVIVVAADPPRCGFRLR